MSTFEFPRDMTQSLSFALFRTDAVPSIGALLARAGEFTERVQIRSHAVAELGTVPGSCPVPHPGPGRPDRAAAAV